jgi:hypothetical protein
VRLDHAHGLARLLAQCRFQLFQGRHELVLHGDQRREMNRGWDHVVGGLAFVDVIVGVDGLLGAALTAQDLDGPVGDHLVGVHVGGRPRAGLEDIDHELAVVAAIHHFLRRLHDGRAKPGVEQP